MSPDVMILVNITSPYDYRSADEMTNNRNMCDDRMRYLRDFEMETIGMKPTGRNCTAQGCKGKLFDTTLDWEDELPPNELKAAEKHCQNADLVLCLGTR
ncbi:hypothetical protein CBR_g41558 [Chara braunii]|uniref:Deacetylase sirtuin-type domain-containing protein n=1 Tax=Chara braunii TaxID=69332 RepID=A0A388K2T5_CHABU|nr:hypothetical protein CBR_g41558 [Chara braunii]|eukprot:GBG64358.1 hypothetical protein CBR_g41558 [Chara braunii]